MALTGSLGVHAFALWMLGDVGNGAALARLPSPTVDVYILPPPVSEPEIAAKVEPEPETEPEAEPDTANPPPRTAADRPQRPAPVEAATEPAPTEDADSTDPRVSEAVEISRGRVDWSAEMAKIVARMREEAPHYRSFGYPEMSEETRARAARSDRDIDPDEAGNAEIFPWGEYRLTLGEDCYQTGYEPGSVLGEAHRFSNSFVVCSPRGSEEPRNDLFLESKPAYLR